MHKLSFNLRPKLLFYVHYTIFHEFFNKNFNVLVLDMASQRIDETQVSYDKEQEVFTSFTIE